MKSKLILAGLAVAAFLAAPFAAQAADLGPGPAYKAPAYVAPSYGNWGGWYVGINAGYGFGKSDWTGPVPASLSPKGFLAGGTLGYNFQTGSWVWGLEGDFDYSAMKDDSACAAGTCTLKNNWLATARGRIGYGGWSSFMPYITGGAAFAGLKASTTVGGESSSTRIGWTLGAGVEYALWSSWSVKAEYLYASLGKFNCAACGGDDVKFNTSIVRAGLNYRF